MAETSSEQNRAHFSVLPFYETESDKTPCNLPESGASGTWPKEESSWTESSWPASRSPILEVPQKRHAVGEAKISTSFVQTYNAMRGPQQTEPAELVEALHPLGVPAHFREGDETELIGEVENATLNDWRGVDTNLHSLADRRRNVFYLEKGTTQPDQLDSTLGCYESEVKKPDGDTNAGWDAANAPEVPEDTGFVSDEEGEGHPSETRVSPSTFRRLAAGCAGNEWDKDDNKPEIDPKTESVRPKTPENRGRRVVRDRVHFHHIRQWDEEDDEEMSPWYLVPRGAARSIIWSPSGAKMHHPERIDLSWLEKQDPNIPPPVSAAEQYWIEKQAEAEEKARPPRPEEIQAALAIHPAPIAGTLPSQVGHEHAAAAMDAALRNAESAGLRKYNAYLDDLRRYHATWLQALLQALAPDADDNASAAAAAVRRAELRAQCDAPVHRRAIAHVERGLLAARAKAAEARRERDALAERSAELASEVVYLDRQVADICRGVGLESPETVTKMLAGLKLD